MTVYLLTIGDEILIGQIVDTNSAWMSRQLNLQGLRVVAKGSVSDTPEAIVGGIEYAFLQADIVLVTGGLGPTSDDVTKQTLARMFGAELVFQQDVYDRIAAYFERVGRPMPDSIREQAMLPDRAQVLVNKVGTASGMWFERDGKVLVSMPGVPFEMEYLMQREVLPRLKARFPGQPLVHRTLLTVGEGESAIAARLVAFEASLPEHIRLAYLPALGQVRLRLTGRWAFDDVLPDAEQRLAAEVEAELAKLEALLPGLVYGYGEDTLERVVGRILLEQGKQFGTAESCTGGYVAHLITTIPGSSAYFQGAIVSYSYEMKTRQLGVRPETLSRFGAVSVETVTEMAKGALDRLGVDVALAISGIAGPDGGTPDKPVGTVWMAVADRDRVVTLRHVFGRDRLKNIQMTGLYALNLVRKFLIDGKQ